MQISYHWNESLSEDTNKIQGLHREGNRIITYEEQRESMSVIKCVLSKVLTRGSDHLFFSESPGGILEACCN